MPSHKETKTLSYTSKQMFDLVMDVEKYPQFLPWCLAAKITRKFDAKEFNDHFEADLVVNFKGFTQKYSSDVRASKTIDGEYLVSVVAIDGPFKSLVNSWQFKDISVGCEIEFFIDFEFKSMFLGKMMGMVWQKATSKMIDAFETRAASIYE